jgi:HEAT repeat protein
MRRFPALLLVFLLAAPLLVAQDAERLKLVARYSKDLKSRSAETRAEAAESLGKIGMAEAVEPLVGALSDKDASVRRAAASALWEASEVSKAAIPALRSALTDPDVAVVMRAAGALISMDEEESSMEEPLRGVLRNGDEVDRFLAARALIGIEAADKLVGPIVDYLRRNMPDPKVSDWSGRHDNFDMGKKALKRLAETNDRKALGPLGARLNDNPMYLTEPILVALSSFKPRPDNWVPTLLTLLDSPVADVREAAVEALAKQLAAADVKQWAKPVSRLVTDKEKKVRREAIDALSDAKGLAIDAIGPVIQAVRSEPDPDVRREAAEAVGEIANSDFAIDTAVKAAVAKEALPVLTAAVENDANREVRTKALKSIDQLQLDPATTVDVLARVAVEQKDRNLRLDAMQLINNRGKEAASVEARIAPLAKDSDELIRRVAEGALEAMKSDRYKKRIVTTAAAADPAARDKALEFLRERKFAFSEEAYFTALNEVEPEVIKAFLDAGMSPNHKFASSYGNPAISVVLESDEGCNPAVRPTVADTKTVIKMLLSRGADANIVDDRKMTPLMVAVPKCDPEVIKILLGAKANMNAKNLSDSTAFEFGLYFVTDGAAALVDAGFRLSPEKVKIYEEAYAKDPKRLALVRKATKTTTAKKVTK